VSGKILDLIILHSNALGFEKVLHSVEPAKIMFAGQKSLAIYDAVGGDIGELMARIHGIANGAGRFRRTDSPGDRAIRGNAARRNLADDHVDPLKEIIPGGHSTGI